MAKVSLNGFQAITKNSIVQLTAERDANNGYNASTCSCALTNTETDFSIVLHDKTVCDDDLGTCQAL